MPAGNMAGRKIMTMSAEPMAKERASCTVADYCASDREDKEESPNKFSDVLVHGLPSFDSQDCMSLVNFAVPASFLVARALTGQIPIHVISDVR